LSSLQFLQKEETGYLEVSYQFDPNTIGAHITGLFWGMQCLGGILGLFLLKIFDVRVILVAFIVLAIIALAIVLMGSGAEH